TRLRRRRAAPSGRVRVRRSRRSSTLGHMDVRSIEDVAPVVEHNATVPVWWLVSPREMQDITAGGHLELVSEFEVSGGGFVDPHSHPTHEFYYVTAGRGLMTIADETREIAQGDLVHIPPDAVHSLRPVS